MLKKNYLLLLRKSIDLLESLNYSEQFLELCPDFLEKHLPVAEISLFFLNQDKNEFQSYFSRNNRNLKLNPINEKSHMVLSLKNNKKIIILTKQKPLKTKILKKTNADFFEKLSVDLLIPLFSLKQLFGFIAAKASSKTFKEIDSLDDFMKIFANILIPVILDERIRLEDDRHYYRIYRMDRLALVGELAASAAHEIKNPLAGISTYIKYLSENKNLKNQDISEELLIMKQSVKRIDDIIKSLLSFSRYIKKKVKNTNLTEIIDTTLYSIGWKIPPNITLIKNLAQNLIIKTDHQRLQQVLINILFNALDALGKEKGEITIYSYITGRDQLPENELFNISIKDNGPGIADDFKEKLFQPFQTSKEEGTGLGLYTCYGLMKSLGGNIKIISNRKGTEVILSLPYAYEEEEEES